MHAVESSNLIRQVIFGEILSESPIELFFALPPVDEGLSKVLASHFDLCIPLVARLATGIPTLIERCVRRASHLRLGCSVLGRGAEPPQFWVLLIWLEPGSSHVTWVHYDATMCLACFVCSVLPVLHFLRFDLCVL